MSGDVEAIKEASRHLRGSIAEDLAAGGDAFVGDSTILLKFHGIYQQDDRDIRRERTSKKLPLDYSCMVRASVPGGLLKADQWLALDRASELAGGRLRLTTRQGVQFHTVRKGSVRPLISSINDHLVTTIAACGDVVRNTMACPMPHHDGRQAILRPTIDALVARFRPRTRAYWDLWVDGEHAVTVAPGPAENPEPLYGDTYLPRKFKIGIAWPGDNCVSVHSHDVGLVPLLTEGTSGELTGWMIFVGGGMGKNYQREDTFPRLATPLGWVTPEDLAETVETIITVQRDHGERGDRQRARFKYLVHTRGEDWVRAEVEARMGRPLGDPLPVPEWDAPDHLGWTKADDESWVLGIPIPSGTVEDSEQLKLRSAIRLLLSEGLVAEIRITPRQAMLLSRIAPDDRDIVVSVLRDHGVQLADDVSLLRRLAVACPALPTCGLALAESERVLPDVIEGIDKALAQAGISGAPIRLNMTGCPNGCARPYTAEIGIVGRTKSTYDIYLGGSVGEDRMASMVRSGVKLNEIPEVLQPVLDRYATEAETGESLGDFVHRSGVVEVGTWLPAPTIRRRAGATPTGSTQGSATQDVPAQDSSTLESA